MKDKHINILECAKCPITNLPVTVEKRWITLQLLPSNHTISFALIGSNIVYSKQAGSASEDSLKRAYELLGQYTSTFSPSNQYLLIEDVEELGILPRRLRSIPRKFHHNDYNKKALIIYSPSILAGTIVTAMTTLFKARIPIYSRTTYSSSIELAKQIAQASYCPPTKTNFSNGSHNKKRISEVVSYLTSINWSEEGELRPPECDDQYQEIYSAITWIKNDFDEAIKEKEEASRKTREVEHHFNILTDASMDLILLVNKSGEIEYHSNSIHSISEKIVVGQKITTLFTLAEGKNAQAYFDTTINHDLNSCFESQIIYQNSKSIPVEIRLRKTVCNDTPYIFAIIRDITEQKSNEEFKENLQREIFHTSKLASIGELAAGVGHEINNPLSIVYGNLELLRASLKDQDILSEDKERYLDRQERAINRISDIVKGLKSFARQDDDSIHAVDLNKTVESTLAFIQEIYKKDGIAIKQNTTPLPLFTLANNGKLQQVLINLISNAKDATKEIVSPKITITTSREHEDAAIEVADNGTGIKEKNLIKVFDNFFTTKEVGKGTGLGLGIAKNIIEDYDGSISISSKIDRGTTVTIKLPLCEAIETNIAVSTSITKRSFSGKALVVDDESDIRIIMCDLLNDLGIETDSAANGIEALQMIDSNKYEYIFSDLKMPGMSGEEMISYIHANNIHSGKIFIVTGMLSNLASTLNVDGILEKPFDSDQVYHLLDRKL